MYLLFCMLLLEINYYYTILYYTSNSTLDHAAPSFLVASATRQLHQTSAGLRAPNISWHCTSCSIPQLTTGLPNSPTSINKSFSSHDITTSPTNNRLVSQPTTTVQRQAHKPLKIININFQSIKNKTAELGNFICVSDPDILIGTETWLNQTITDNEMFPPGYSHSLNSTKRQTRWV